ncbi:hypothetical protein QQZ08_010347 [Neonectria magnoliae]|uniref:VOC domain-containing protein n=1 Tax=Neonectria magnoliae TaxID=2732573 RepID=A0ABR1HIE0_9HYPO
MSAVVVKALDHLVLTCASVEATSKWYSKYLGMEKETFASEADSSTERVALKFGDSKINLHQRGKEFEPKASTALPGTADLCFLVQDGTSLDDAIALFEKDAIAVLEGGKTVLRTGARGPIRSIYVRDPDGNLVELSHYLD